MITFLNRAALIKAAKIAVIVVGISVLPVYRYIDMNSNNSIDVTLYAFFISTFIIIIGMTLLNERLGRLSIIIAIILSTIWFLVSILGRYQVF